MMTNLFIVGTTRSGTSALRNALSETRYRGPGEGHSIGLLGSLSDSIDLYYSDHAEALNHGTMLAKWDREQFLADLAAAYIRQIRSTFPGGFYLDKTPNVLPIRYARLIETHIPGTKFIFCRRRGIDNVISKRRKFPDATFYEHCTEWADIINLWDTVRPQLTAPVLEIDFYEMFASQELLSTRIADFLELPEDERDLFMRHLLEHLPQKSPWLPLMQSGWTLEETETFMSVCGPTMERYGYGTESYWAES